MQWSTLIGLLPLLAALTAAVPLDGGAISPIARRADADAASVYSVDKVGTPFPCIDGF